MENEMTIDKDQIAELESLRAENEGLKKHNAGEWVDVAATMAQNHALRARLAELEAQEPVHWRALLSASQQHWNLAPNIAGFTTLKAAEQFCAEKKDFGGWNYELEPLFAAPVVSPDVDKLKAEIVSLRQQICASQSNVMARDEYIQSLTTELVAVLKDAEHKQCRIDELILEFCPSEMTADQLNRWRKCQIPAIEQASSCNELHEKGGM